MSEIRPIKRALVDFNKDWALAPMELIVLGLLLVALVGHWQKSRDLTHACELLLDHDVGIAIADAHKGEVDALCIAPSPEE
jgi:hypothetical protein